MSAKQRLLASRIFTKFGGIRMLIPQEQNPYIVIAVFGQPIAVVKSPSDEQKAADKFRDMALCFIIAASLKAVREVRPSRELPAPILNCFTRYLPDEFPTADVSISSKLIWIKEHIRSYRSKCGFIFLSVFFVTVFVLTGLANAESNSESLLVKVSATDSSKFQCVDDRSDVIQYLHGKRKYLIRIPSLVGSPVIQRTAVCRKFLEKWFSSIGNDTVNITLADIVCTESSDCEAVSIEFEDACQEMDSVWKIYLII